jgi:hypothetical protein
MLRQRLPAQIRGLIDFNDLNGPADEDLFRFHAVGGKTYVIVNNGNSASVRFLDEHFVPVPDAPEHLYVSERWTAPATGTYYLKVYGFQYQHSTVSGPYSFSLFEAPQEEQSQKPLQLEVGGTITGQFYYPDDERMFTIDIPARNRYRFILNAPAWGSLYLTGVEAGYEFAADADQDGLISKSATLEAGKYEVYIQSPSPGGFILLADLASNFKNDSGTDEENETEEDAIDSGDDAGDLENFYGDDEYVDESGGEGGVDISQIDASDWLDGLEDPLDEANSIVW